jgi:CelD/BcsL family acetyltransferase involved in cellulose biosynthesis
MYKITVASVSDLESSRDQWNLLVRSMDRPSIFCTWEWIYTWWKHFGAPYSLRILFVYDGGELIGILPLGLRYMLPEDSLVPVRVLSFCGTYELFPDHTDLIHAGVYAKPCLKAILGFLSCNFKDWDVLHFSHVAEDRQLIKFFSHKEFGLHSDLRQVSIAPYIALKSSHDNNFEKYMQSLSRNKRHDLRRRRKALHTKYGINYRHSGPNQSGMGIRRLFELHAMRASSKKMKSSFQGEKLLQFHERISGIFAEDGALFLRFLATGETVVAALYGFLFAGRLFAYQSGLDPEWESKGVGSVLMLEAIEEAAERGLTEIDFLRGSEAYKGAWTSEARTLYDIWVYNTTARSTLFRLTNRVRSAGKGLICRLAS